MKLVFTFSFIIAALALQAQDILPNKIYRVSAYQSGNNNIVSRSNYAEVVPPASIFVPNAFTPNNDGINDTFGVKGEGIRNFRMLIFNRWGEVIYESANPSQHWDGKYRGNTVENGTYVYEIYALGLGKKPKTGSVTVVR